MKTSKKKPLLRYILLSSADISEIPVHRPERIRYFLNNMLKVSQKYLEAQDIIIYSL